MQITPEEQSSVLRALQNEEYDWRTVDGVAAETGLTHDKIAVILDSLSDQVVRSSATDSKRRALFTTRNRYYHHVGLANRVLTVLTDRIR